MRLKKLEIKNFRNIEHMEFDPCDKINVIYGDNAQGKTNIIEAIWLFTGNQSFRGSKKQEMVKFECEETRLNIKFEDEKRIQEANINLGNNKIVKLNNVELNSLSELNGKFYCVVFSPSHLSFITDGPKNRRRFIDIAISQIKPQYKNYLSTYEKLLKQRNALLKSSEKYINLQCNIDVWDIQIAKVGTIISIYRNDYIKKLLSISKEIYNNLSSKKENFNIKYISTVYKNIDEINIYEEKQVDIYYQKLKENYINDLRLGYTTCGIHSDDIEIYIDDLLVKTYGSQGQQRSSVITLKLSEAYLLKRITGENPIMLLDDVMSELDESRQDYILNNLKDMQVFITCCDVKNTIKLNKGKIFEIKKGFLEKADEIN